MSFFCALKPWRWITKGREGKSNAQWGCQTCVVCGQLAVLSEVSCRFLSVSWTKALSSMIFGYSWRKVYSHYLSCFWHKGVSVPHIPRLGSVLHPSISIWRFPIHGVSPKSSILFSDFHEINHPAMGVPPWIGTPRLFCEFLWWDKTGLPGVWSKWSQDAAARSWKRGSWSLAFFFRADP